MRTGRVVLAAVVLLALSGCVPAGGGHASSPTPSATPVFASDAEALAAAEKAYANYLKVSASITAEGGVNPSRIDALVTTDQISEEHEVAKYYSDRALRTEGTPVVERLKAEQVVFDSTGAAEITFYVCVDATNTRVVDSLGADATPVDRPDRVALEVTMSSAKKKHSDLLVAGSETWSGTGVC